TGYAEDTGAPGDGITGDNALGLSGTAEQGAVVEVFDGATSLGTTSADGTGHWRFDTATFSDGGHSFTAQATDAAGNTGAASTAVAVTVDTTAPAAPAITGYSDDTGVSGDGITGDKTLSLSGSAEAGAVVQVFDGASSLGTAS